MDNSIDKNAEVDPVKAARKDVPQFALYNPQNLSPPDHVLPNPDYIVILDQGIEGASVGHGMAAMINYLLHERGIYEQVSVRMLQQLSKQYGNMPLDEDNGSMINDGMRGWHDHGVCPESLWPYKPGDYGTLTPERSKAALQFRPAIIQRIPNNIEIWRAAIFEHHAAIIGFTVHESINSPEVAKTGIVPIPKKNERVQGGHAVAVLGYTPEGFLIQNSWGPNWGNLKIGDQIYRGMALLPNYYFTKGLANEGYFAILPDTLTARRLLRRAGYKSDTLENDDRLNITPDVDAVCSVLAARDVKPPLALGLFGNWGTGKSFFMKRMYDEIDSLKKLERENPGETPYCSEIVQIRFNAWHYLDTNLWASLVSEIFQHLLAAVSDPQETSEQTRKRVVRQLGQAQGFYRQSRMELENAKHEQEIAQASLVEKTELCRSQQATLTELSDQLVTLLAAEPEVQKNLNRLADELGVPKLAQSYTILKAQAQEIVTLSGRMHQLLRVIFDPHGRRDRLILLIGLLAGPALIGALISWLAHNFTGLLQEISRVLNLTSGLLISAVVLLAKLLRGNKLIGSLQNAFAKIERIRDERLEAMLQPEKIELDRTSQAQHEAQLRLVAAKQRIEILEKELVELNPSFQMQAFLSARTSSEDYKKQLGLISLVRRDFERLSELLQTSEALEARWYERRRAALQAGKKFNQPKRRLLPLQRIILYIDDLDRCQPNRVIEVLEAVHLLLAFPLFVVVVAVDPRWLRQCLEIHYPELLSKAKGIEDDEEGLHQPSTPQDYLEKIFQIPFYLRPINELGYRSLIDGLAGADVATAGKRPSLDGSSPEYPAQANTTGEAEIRTISASVKRPEIQGNDGKGKDSNAQAAPTASLKEPSEKLKPEQLKFQEWELEDMKRLAPLFRTPRAVKRFVNTYRLLRVSITSSELPSFEGTAKVPGHYRVAQILLAIVAGYPNSAPRFLQQMLGRSRSVSAHSATWDKFLNECLELAKTKSQLPTVNKMPKNTNSGTTQPPKLRNGTPRGNASRASLQYREREIAYYWQEWIQMCKTLRQVSQNGFLPHKLNEYYNLVPKVARFSFSVSMLPE